ncbi:MAG TPA: rod shape-determining protein MreD [Acetobacteraceae bacterium]|jgi:rod shape-determining protein MreD|nr:rod shape-determining protein MreD [Acetobacteraceae bacterium]
MPREDQFPGIRPRPSLGRRLDILARQSFPASTTILLMLLCGLPFGIADQATLLPSVTVGCVYFWSLFRPASLPPPVVFLIGLLLDLLGYLPIGVGVLTLLILHGVVLRARRSLTQQGFILVWLAQICVGIVAAGLIWTLTSLLDLQLMPAGPAAFQAMLTAALYPALAIVLTTAHRTLAAPERL